MALADTLNRRTLGSLHEDPAAPRKHIDVGLLVVTGLISLIGLALDLQRASPTPHRCRARSLLLREASKPRSDRRWHRPRGHCVDRLPQVPRVGGLLLRRQQRGALARRVATGFEIERRAGLVPARIVPAATIRVREDHAHRRACRGRRVCERASRSQTPRRRAAHRAHPRRPDHAAARPRERAGHRGDHDGHVARRRSEAPTHRCSDAARTHQRRGDPADRHAEAVPARPPHGLRRPGQRRPAYQQTSRRSPSVPAA